MREPSRSALLAAGLAAWWCFLAVDFVLHASVFAAWWQATATYWLPPEQLFARIPVGYAAFALYVGALLWLLRRLHGSRPAPGVAAGFGLRAGVLAGTTWALATYSVFAMPPSALLVWAGSLALESMVAAGVSAWVLAGARAGRRALLAGAAGLLGFVLGVVLQNL
jgi:hypothetical protein